MGLCAQLPICVEYVPRGLAGARAPGT
eukprot:COSAG03_NODE_14485_length_462_cov_1.837466_1_plen_26_part_10